MKAQLLMHFEHPSENGGELFKLIVYLISLPVTHFELNCLYSL